MRNRNRSHTQTHTGLQRRRKKSENNSLDFTVSGKINSNFFWNLIQKSFKLFHKFTGNLNEKSL